MIKKWESTGLGDHVRLPQSFQKFESALPDPQAVLPSWLEATQIVPLWSREWKSRGPWSVGPRTLGDSMWFCFANTSGDCEIHGEKYSFTPGSLILVPKGTEHTVRLDSPHEAQQLTVHFQAYVYGGVNLLDLLGFPFYIPKTNSIHFTEVSHQITRLFAIKPPGWNILMAQLIFQVLLGILHHHGPLFKKRGSETLQPKILRLLPALKLIENQFANPSLTVSDMEKAVHVSSVYLRRLFIQVSGVSPIRFLQRRRIEHACLQLRQSQKTIAHIAELSGFNDLPYFYRAFHRWVKMTPIEYRDARKRD